MLSTLLGPEASVERLHVGVGSVVLRLGRDSDREKRDAVRLVHEVRFVLDLDPDHVGTLEGWRLVGERRNRGVRHRGRDPERLQGLDQLGKPAMRLERRV